MGPNVRISTISALPVAMELARSAIATLPPDKRSPMMPEPTTAASKSAVPTHSATNARIYDTQQLGPQHDLAGGFAARMNALENALSGRPWVSNPSWPMS